MSLNDKDREAALEAFYELYPLGAEPQLEYAWLQSWRLSGEQYMRELAAAKATIAQLNQMLEAKEHEIHIVRDEAYERAARTCESRIGHVAPHIKHFEEALNTEAGACANAVRALARQSPPIDSTPSGDGE